MINSVHIELRQRKSGHIEFGIIYGGIALIALAVVRFLPALTTVLPSCLFRDITGMPCPTCGSTRALLRLSHGDVPGSLAMNPLLSVILIIAIISFLYGGLTLLPGAKRICISLSGREKETIRSLVILLFLVHWGYLIVTLSG